MGLKKDHMKLRGNGNGSWKGWNWSMGSRGIDLLKTYYICVWNSQQNNKNTNKTTKESYTKGNVKGVFQEEIKEQSEILT